jgi:hypothetical protein
MGLSKITKIIIQMITINTHYQKMETILYRDKLIMVKNKEINS